MKNIEIEQIYTAIITLSVKPGLDKEFELWQEKITQIALEFEGHLGVNMLRPPSDWATEYVIVLRFNGYQNLMYWINSSERSQLLQEVQPLLEKPQETQILEGMANWFTLPGKPMIKPPAKYKMVILLWSAVFALGIILNPLISNLLSFLPQLAISGVTTIIIVLILTYFLMPLLTKILSKWLNQP